MPEPWENAYKMIDISEPEPRVLAEFEELPLDTFTGGRQYYRRFSRYRMGFDEVSDRGRSSCCPTGRSSSPGWWHNATDIAAEDDAGGHRDLRIVAISDWDNREYGDEFEQAVAQGDGATTVPMATA
ncbi:hypothetical protein ACI2L1_34470 [Streptomyces sp. NPDC019531]|uniref:hypothetical protein n=1 Tax=Streptomyces sp. NPDC019531 TaxID=3365062 RepID=UPI0038509123